MLVDCAPVIEGVPNVIESEAVRTARNELQYPKQRGAHEELAGN